MSESPRKFHPAADFFPLMSGDEFEAFATDVKRSGGARTPVVFRFLPDGSKEYLDGRNRLAACAQEGLPCPEREYDGDGPVDQWIISENLHGRRQLNGSQRAVAAIYARRSHIERDGADHSEGEWGEYYSKKYGTNRNYLYAVQSMLEELPHLLEEIRDGRSTVRDAQEVLKKHRLKAAKADDAPIDGIGEEPPGESGELSPDDGESSREQRGEKKDLPPVTDGMGEPVPHEYRQEFAARNLFAETLSRIAAASESLEALTDAEGSDWLDPAEAKASLKNLDGLVRAAAPYGVCPTCDGSRRLLDHQNRKVRCGRCDGYGYVNQARYDGTFTMERQN